MERLVVDAGGKVTIPAHILERRGLHPGDELVQIEADEGLLLYQHGLALLTARWWRGLSENERRQAQAVAVRYENLSADERNRLWNEGAESIEEEVESQD